MNTRRWFTTASRSKDTVKGADRRRAVPSCERLETISLLSTASPVISGYVFADANNDGHPQATEAPVAGTRLGLVNASGAVVGSATTDAHGFYAFSTDATVNTATKSVTETLTLPADFTNIDSAPFSSALSLFDPTLGRLVDVKVSAGVNVASTLQGQNTSLTDGADISGAVTGEADVEGLSEPLSGTLSAASPVFHAGPSEGTTFNLARRRPSPPRSPTPRTWPSTRPPPAERRSPRPPRSTPPSPRTRARATPSTRPRPKARPS